MEIDSMCDDEINRALHLLIEGRNDEFHELLKTSRFEQILRDENSNLVNNLVSVLDDTSNYAKANFVDSCEYLFDILVEISNLEAIFVSLLESVDEERCSVPKFCVLLKALKKILLKWSTSRGHFLEYTLSTIKYYLDRQPSLDDHSVQNDEKEPLICHRLIDEIIVLMENLLEFRDSFIDGRISSQETISLIVFSFQMLSEPALFVYDDKIDKMRRINEKIAKGIDRLIADNCHHFFKYLSEKCMEHKLYSREDSHQLIEENEDDTLREAGDFISGARLRISVLQLAVYYYVKTQNEIFNALPLVYDKLYIFHKLLVLGVELANHQHNAVTRKGLLLIERLLQSMKGGNICIPSCVLELKVHEEFVRVSSSVSVYSSICSNRQSAIASLLAYIRLLDAQASYQFYLNVWKTISYDDVEAEIVTELRRRIYTNSITANCDIYFQGKFLVDLLKVITRLEDDTKIDLLRYKSKAISITHVFALIIRKDAYVRSHFEYFDKIYFSVLKKAITESREAFKRERFEASNKFDKNAAQSFDVVVEGQTLPELSNADKISSAEKALVALDVIECALSLVYQYASESADERTP